MNKLSEDIILDKYVYSSSFVLKIYKMIKFVLGKLSNSSELLRLCQNEKLRETKITYRIDQTLFYSNKLKTERIKLLNGTKEQLEEAYEQILRKKKFYINNTEIRDESKILMKCILRLKETYDLQDVLTKRANIAYDSSNKEHEDKLMELWKLMKDEEKLTARKSEQWQTIGFQGIDPATDFRGMGILGLEQLIYFAQNFNDTAKHVLSCSHHKISWYSFAITGINLTALELELLRERYLQYYLISHEASIESFNEFYCYLFTEFNNYWFKRPEPVTVMDFNDVFKSFKGKIIKNLTDQIPIIVDTDKKKY
ncbi:hypothetical protein BCR36DRAFT_408464 [Piromyces finnis]|uniref:ELMO domain-containing protein n=1 Tax=Piromyces finnis TaxID=1754191 RepID=A0A1Y1VMF9_9FUNG|nr:hypothetical protein BCR36DRAFT_408464 [Piromyces finnis]|eukprot:ORX60103.1 hypothetical protein BCR36DRAFT_408464 [Piromyces finnis]